MTTELHSLDELSELLGSISDVIAVRTAFNELLLVTETEEGKPIFQGFPTAGGYEEGTGVVHNLGWVSKLSVDHWPLTYVGSADPYPRVPEWFG